MPAPLSDLQPMSSGDILDRAVFFYRRFLPSILVLATAAFLLFTLVQVLLATAGLPGGGRKVLGGRGAAGWLEIFFWPVFLLAFLGHCALGRFTVERYLGGTSSLWGLFGAAIRRSPSLTGAGFVLLLLTVLPAALVETALGEPLPWGHGGFESFADWAFRAVGGFLVVALRLPFVLQVILIEGLPGWAAFRRSRHLGRGNVARAMGVFLFCFAATVAGDLLGDSLLRIAGVYRSHLFGGVATVLARLSLLLATSFAVVASTLLYLDCRVRREGLDLEVVLAQLRIFRGAPARSMSNVSNGT